MPIEPASTEEVVDAPIPDHLGEVFEDEQPAEGQGKRIQKESAYIRRLRDGDVERA